MVTDILKLFNIFKNLKKEYINVFNEKSIEDAINTFQLFL